jgi:DOMON domain
LNNETDNAKLKLDASLGGYSYIDSGILEVIMKKIYRLLLAASLVSAALILWACTTAPTQTTAPPSAPGNAPPAETVVPQSAPFTADGIITPGEYASNQTYDDYQIYWNNDDSYVYIAMKAKTTGFVAVGIQPGFAMKDADIILGFVKDGQAQVFDMYSTGNFGPHPQDTELGGTDDILLSGGNEDGQYTTIEFKRALKTGDKYDNELVKGINKIIWAYGPNKDPSIKHSNRGYGQIEIK